MNGEAEGQRSPRYNSRENSERRMSGSPRSRRDSPDNRDDPEDRRTRRRSSRSMSPRGRRSRSGERRADEPYTQVYVSGFSSSIRISELEDLFSNQGKI